MEIENQYPIGKMEVKAFTLWHYLQASAWHGKYPVARINYLRDKMK